MESVCKHIVDKHLKGSARRGCVKKANAIASLRYDWKIGEADQFFDRRNLADIEKPDRMRNLKPA